MLTRDKNQAGVERRATHIPALHFHLGLEFVLHREGQIWRKPWRSELLRAEQLLSRELCPRLGFRVVGEEEDTDDDAAVGVRRHRRLAKQGERTSSTTLHGY